MNQTFSRYRIDLVNGVEGDPAALVKLNQSRAALLFDLGDITRLSEKEIISISHVFISHTHMDHFIGFDQLIRKRLRNWKPIVFFGPPDIGKKISFRLQSYTWNLLTETDLHMSVYELTEGGSLRRGYLNIGTDLECVWEEEKITSQSFAFGQLKIIPLNHLDITSMAYSIKLPTQVTINAQKLKESKLPTGPWVAILKKLVSEKSFDQTINVKDKTFTVRNLVESLDIEVEDHSISYMSDFSFDAVNLKSLQDFKDTTHLICEATFTSADLRRAIMKAHLTAKQTSLIAVMLGAEYLTTFHKSAIYSKNTDCPMKVAKELFAKYKELSPKELNSEITRELNNINASQT